MLKNDKKEEFELLKKQYQKLSGFQLENTDLSSIQKEIKDMSWTLCCEIDSSLRKIESKIAECFIED